jgi:large subunit ribosomal protein L6
MPVPIPDGVSVDRIDGGLRVKGPKGTLSERLPDVIEVQIADGRVVFLRPDDKKENRALHGLARALVANMMKGVVQPFVKELEIQGVGYRADVSGGTLNLLLGFSHPVAIPVPKGLTVSVDRNVIVKVEGIDRQQVGQFAADLRSIRPPEPYKGKGIRYVGEHIRRKVGKAAAGSGTA